MLNCPPIRELFGSGNMTDVTLSCRGGAAFHAHKVVLAAASAYFRNFFEEVGASITQHQERVVSDCSVQKGHISTLIMRYAKCS